MIGIPRDGLGLSVASWIVSPFRTAGLLFVALVTVCCGSPTPEPPSASSLDADLISAVEAGDTRSAQRLLSEGASPNAMDPNSDRGFSVLSLSLERTEMVKVLLARGADPNLSDHNGLTPLAYAVAMASLESVKLLVKAGAQLDARGPLGETLLHPATSSGSTETVEFLLARGLDVNARDKHGMTPLHSCVVAPLTNEHQLEIAKLLVEHGAEVGARDAKGKTAYDYLNDSFFKSRPASGDLRALIRPPKATPGR